MKVLNFKKCMIIFYLKPSIVITDLEEILHGIERENTLKILFGEIIRKKRI